MNNFEIFPFSFPVKTPFKERKGLLLSAVKEDGSKVFAEVSPLPGFSQETLEEAKEQLESLRAFPSQKLFPSVAFGLDCLSYALSSKVATPSSYPLCGFLSGTFEEMQKEIPFLLEEGYEHIKVKVARLSFEEAHAIIQKLLGKAALKIDVNRAWSLKESLSFFSRYPLDAFEYIEEPVSDVKDLPSFPYPTALDETLREENPIPFLPQVKALIVKPMLMGGLDEIRRCMTLAKKLQAKITLSSSYESGIGLFYLCTLLERANIPLHPLGVDTHRLLEKDILVKPHIITKGMLTLSPLEVLTT